MTFSEDNPPPIKEREPFERIPLMEDTNFLGELTALINWHSVEGFSNTPDYILAEYLINCLNTFQVATGRRDLWYGMEPVTKRIANMTRLTIDNRRDAGLE